MEAINFLSNWITWLLIIIPVGAVAMIVYQATKKSISNDENTTNDCNIKIKNTLKGAIIGMTLSGLITVIKSFYI